MNFLADLAPPPFLCNTPKGAFKRKISDDDEGWRVSRNSLKKKADRGEGSVLAYL